MESKQTSEELMLTFDATTHFLQANMDSSTVPKSLIKLSGHKPGDELTDPNQASMEIQLMASTEIAQKIPLHSKWKITFEPIDEEDED